MFIQFSGLILSSIGMFVSNKILTFVCLISNEGVFLPKLCEAQGSNPRREMAEIRSSGIVAPAPGSVLPLMHVVVAPAMAPAYL